MSEGRQSIKQGGDMPLFWVAAHELKSPLALIRQLSAGEHWHNLSPAEQTEILGQIQLTSERALRLTSDLTKAKRLEDSLFDRETINALALAEEVAAELSPLFKARGKTIEVGRQSRPPLVVANRDLLRRILLNFADNALNYAENSQPVVLSATCTGRGRTVRIKVRDYGPGLPKSMRRSFMHQPLPISRRPDSSGLGLYLARQFAEAMNGSIGAVHHRDGASFYVDLDGSTQLRLL